MENVKRYPLGWKERPYDARDYSTKAFIEPADLRATPIRSASWGFPSISLDQGMTGHCCGFMDADFLINLPINTDCENQDGHDFYYMCKEFDGEPRNEDGSNLRSAAKVLRQIGAINNYAFAPNIESIKYWLLNNGPVMMGTLWMSGMWEPDANNVVHATGSYEGGHAWLANEYIEPLDLYGIQNSWGASWGDNGKAYISGDDLKKLLALGGEALVAVELEKAITDPAPTWLENLIMFIISLFRKEK